MLKIAWDPIYVYPLPEGHRFPMQKYELLPQQLLHEGTILEENLFAPQPMAEQLILTTHSPRYWYKLKTLQLDKQEIRRTGFPLSMALVRREVVIMQGTVDCCRYAFDHGIALNVAGGTHHAYADRGEGFCLLNDIALAANFCLQQGMARQVLVIDLDVHQGNGTAKIFEDNPAVFTFSMHGEHNYPMHKERSDLDVGLPDGIEDAAYLALVRQHVPALLDQVQPQIVFYQCGVDILNTDKLGRLKVSRDGCRERDRIVLTECQLRGIPVVASVGGGYSAHLRDVVEAHANTFRLAQQLYG